MSSFIYFPLTFQLIATWLFSPSTQLKHTLVNSSKTSTLLSLKDIFLNFSHTAFSIFLYLLMHFQFNPCENNRDSCPPFLLPLWISSQPSSIFSHQIWESYNLSPSLQLFSVISFQTISCFPKILITTLMLITLKHTHTRALMCFSLYVWLKVYCLSQLE